ncbi:hypothetical protein TorRG33x02_026770 [Trema orientale]|uniref:Uncharacterized protein n=1 Tax=Trema orientale TaxID=63057 RepID=A0A2P5FUB3_TREOI|nr:hypothetical protein TorRG33x02_026770 [Trema orientale]
MDHIWMMHNSVIHNNANQDIAACLRYISSSYSTFSEGLLILPPSSRTNE